MIVVLDLVLGLVNITSVKSFALNFDLFLLFETTALVYIFQCFVFEF